MFVLSLLCVNNELLIFLYLLSFGELGMLLDNDCSSHRVMFSTVLVNSGEFIKLKGFAGEGEFGSITPSMFLKMSLSEDGCD